MSKESQSYNKWVETGYYLFGEMGPEELNVKAISEACGLHRPNFYYNFTDKDDLIDELLRKHFKNFSNFENELEENFETFLPDLYLTVVKYKQAFKFHWQLFLHRYIIKYNHVFHAINYSKSKIIVPKFKKYYELDTTCAATESLWATLLDGWFARIDFEKFTVDELCQQTEHTMETLFSICHKFN